MVTWGRIFETATNPKFRLYSNWLILRQHRCFYPLLCNVIFSSSHKKPTPILQPHRKAPSGAQGTHLQNHELSKWLLGSELPDGVATFEPL